MLCKRFCDVVNTMEDPAAPSEDSSQPAAPSIAPPPPLICSGKSPLEPAIPEIIAEQDEERQTEQQEQQKDSKEDSKDVPPHLSSDRKLKR